MRKDKKKKYAKGINEVRKEREKDRKIWRKSGKKDNDKFRNNLLS